MSIDMNEELPDPTPRGEDVLVQQTLADMAWMLQVTRNPLLLSSLVRADLKDHAATAEVALSTRYCYLFDQVSAREESGDDSIDCDPAVYAAYGAWKYGGAASIEEAVLAQMAPIGVSLLG